MSEYVIKMPDVGEGVAEAEVVEWHVRVGDAIHEDDVIVDVMTDKATVELPSPVDGVIRWLGAEVGDLVAVGTEIVRIDTDGAAAAVDDETEVAAETAAEAPVEEPTETPARRPTTAAPVSAVEERVASTDRPTAAPTAAPAVRARARRLGIELADVTGSGPDGRIVHDDLDALLVERPRTAPLRPRDDARPDVEHVKIVGLRRNIAERMQASKRRIPHFTYVEELDVTALEELRAELNATRSPSQPKLTVLPFIMLAVVQTVPDHPEMNARFDDEAGVVDRHRAVHLGIAVQTRRGLMVPVVKDADRRDVWSCAAEVARLSESARDASVTLEELSGSTITITSLGALGGVVSTPVINAPEVAIVGVNKIMTRPMYVDGALAARQYMNLSSSFDHRVIDGLDAAEFIHGIKRLIETPALLFVL